MEELDRIRTRDPDEVISLGAIAVLEAVLNSGIDFGGAVLVSSDREIDVGSLRSDIEALVSADEGDGILAFYEYAERFRDGWYRST